MPLPFHLIFSCLPALRSFLTPESLVRLEELSGRLRRQADALRPVWTMAEGATAA